MSRYNLSSQAIADQRNIWEFIAADNIDAADRVLEELRSQFKEPAESHGLGHR
jgi:plasmid stabilization system protein ParE